MTKLDPGAVLSSTWILGRQLGEGAHAKVFEVSNKNRTFCNFSLVAKVCPIPRNDIPRKKRSQEDEAYDALYHEFICYQGHLRNHPNIPKLPDCPFKDDNFKGRLGKNMDSYFLETKPWSLPQIASYGKKMLQLLKILHEKCSMIFVDVKPENFAFGMAATKQSNSIYLLDFGLSDRYKAAQGGHKPMKLSPGKLIGTPEYLSLRCHAGCSPSRISDVEALGYILIRWVNNGTLPWSEARSDADGLSLKNTANVDEYCKNCVPLARWIKESRAAEFEAEPNYSSFIECLTELEKLSGSIGKAENVSCGAKLPPSSNISRPLEIKAIEPTAANMKDMNYVETANSKGDCFGTPQKTQLKMAASSTVDSSNARTDLAKYIQRMTSSRSNEFVSAESQISLETIYPQKVVKAKREASSAPTEPVRHLPQPIVDVIEASTDRILSKIV